MDNALSKQARVKWVDITKGILILFVVLGHSITAIGTTDIVSRSVIIAIYTVHMPLFFILAGYTYTSKNISFKTFLFAKLKRLMLPYLCFIIVNTIFGLIFGEYSFASLIDDLKFEWYNIILMTEKSKYSSLWFLPTLTVSLLIFFILEKRIKKTQNIIIISIVLALIGRMWYLSKCGSVFGMREALLAQLFVLIGNYLKRLLKWIDNNSISLLLFISCCILWLYGTVEWIHFNNSTINYWNSDVAPITWTVPLSIVGSMTLISFTKALSKKDNAIYNRIFCYLGINSIYIYGLHYSFLRIFLKYLSGFVDSRIMIITNTLLVMAATVVVLEMYKKAKKVVMFRCHQSSNFRS